METRTLLLVVGMLITGVCNTILIKFQDMTCVEHCDDPERSKHFEQPVWQTFNMFIGETLCFILVRVIWIWEYYRNKTRYIPLNTDSTSEELTGWLVYLFWLPTLCDIFGTTLMNVGLFYTTASVFQMLRGVIVLFTGSFSVLFLHRRLYAYHWFSLFLVVLGVSVVGLSGILFPASSNQVDSNSVSTDKDSSTLKAFIGVFFVLFAQVFGASQFVIEEKIMESYHVKPLRAVGLEGIFGLLTVGVCAIILHFTIGINHPGGYFDISTGWNQIISFKQIWITGISVFFSIAFFNFFGLSVTQTLSATSRSTIDTSRIVLIWMVSLILGWESFSWFQAIGFIILVLGTSMFNNVIRPPPCFTVPNVQEIQPLLPEDQ